MELNFLLALLAAFLVGVGKSGFKGMGIVIVTLLVLAYGAKNSVGILLPLLIVGDILAVIWFKKHVKIKYLLQFLPPMVLGVVVAAYFGNGWDELVFKKWMSIIIIGSTIYMFWTEYRKVIINTQNPLVSSVLGFAAGFATMIGNLAGPFSNLYFLATRLPKNEIIGTAAWVFFIINLFKIPFHVFSWETITWQTLKIDATLALPVIAGFFLGVRLIGYFSEIAYRRFLLIVTGLGALVIFVK